MVGGRESNLCTCYKLRDMRRVGVEKGQLQVSVVFQERGIASGISHTHTLLLG